MGTSTANLSMTSLGLLTDTKLKNLFLTMKQSSNRCFLKTFIVGNKLIKQWKLYQNSYSQGLLILSQDSKQEAEMDQKEHVLTRDNQQWITNSPSMLGA